MIMNAYHLRAKSIVVYDQGNHNGIPTIIVLKEAEQGIRNFCSKEEILEYNNNVYKIQKSFYPKDCFTYVRKEDLVGPSPWFGVDVGELKQSCIDLSLKDVGT